MKVPAVTSLSIDERNLHMKLLVVLMTLVLGWVFMQARAFAALPNAKPENRNVVVGRQAIEAKDFKLPWKL